MSDKLRSALPCPFCGGEAKEIEDDSYGCCVVGCPHCDIWFDGIKEELSSVRNGWNRRHAPAGSVEPVDGNLRERQAFVEGYQHRIDSLGDEEWPMDIRNAEAEAYRRYGRAVAPADGDPGSTHWEECPECMGSGWVRVSDGKGQNDE